MNFFLEIGFENIPSRYLKKIIDSFKKEYIKGILFKDFKVLGTYRRIVITFKLDKIVQLSETIKGPSAELSLTEGRFNEIAEGFAKSKGYTTEDLEVIKTPKGNYISLNSTKSYNLEEVIINFIKKSLFDIEFDKSMNWNGFNFIRPINWICCFLENRKLDISLGDVSSSDFTYPNRSLSLSKIYITSYENYFSSLKNMGVLLSFEERKNVIIDFIKNYSDTVQEDLIEEISGICEFPKPFLCSFNEEFSMIPSKIIEETIIKHQKAIPVINMNSFITVRDGININDKIIKDNEKVVKARLKDAEFFYNEDIKHNLEYFNDSLKYIVFQKNLENFDQKRLRLINLSLALANNIDVNLENLKRAANLSKADLSTNVVKEKEYKLLRGYIGSEYAKKTENESVSLAIFEHYLPRFKDDLLPSDKIGALISIADKLDNILGSALSSSLPTGARDPFYIRRECIGIIEIILKFNFQFSISEILKKSYMEYENQKLNLKSFADIKNELIEFIKNRIESHFNYPKGLIKSLIHCSDDIINFKNRLDLLLSNYNFLENLIELSKRVRNITKDTKTLDIDEKLFEKEEEIQLFNEILLLESIKDSNEFIKELIIIKVKLNDFFEKVIVNSNDILIKNNRLALLKKLDNLMNSFANFSLI